MNQTDNSRHPSDGLLCRDCPNPGLFITPHGLACSSHTFSYLKEEPGWLPVRTKLRESYLELESL